MVINIKREIIYFLLILQVIKQAYLKFKKIFLENLS